MLFLGPYNLLKDFIQVIGQIPVGQMGAQLAEIGDVANVISFSCLFVIFPPYAFSRDLFNSLERLQDRNAIFSSAAYVVDLAGPGILEVLFRRADYVKAVDIVAHLFAFIAKYLVNLARDRHLHEIGEEAVKLDSRVVGAGEAAASENSHIEPKISPYSCANTSAATFEAPKTE